MPVSMPAPDGNYCERRSLHLRVHVCEVPGSSNVSCGSAIPSRYPNSQRFPQSWELPLGYYSIVFCFCLTYWRRSTLHAETDASAYGVLSSLIGVVYKTEHMDSIIFLKPRRSWNRPLWITELCSLTEHSDTERARIVAVGEWRPLGLCIQTLGSVSWLCDELCDSGQITFQNFSVLNNITELVTVLLTYLW